MADAETDRRADVAKTFERLGLTNDTDRTDYTTDDSHANEHQRSDFVITRLSNSARAA